MDQAAVTFSRWVTFWRQRWDAKGENFSGTEAQTRAIGDILLGCFNGKDYYADALDFGCGHGRFEKLMGRYCGHIWAVDILDGPLEACASRMPTITPLRLDWPAKLPLRPEKVDLAWAFFVFQHIVDPTIFQQVTQELRRVLKTGSRMLIIDNAVDTANHVRSRGPEALITALGLRPGARTQRITVGKPQDHWLIDGVKA